MNKNQIKSAIAKFKSADVSIIKDEALRNKAQNLQAKQKGFTLLELLVVITLLATIATAGLVAYEGIGENAQAAASAKNILSAENSIRNYRALEGEYPNQWDNLTNSTAAAAAADTAGTAPLLAAQTQDFIGTWAMPIPTGTADGSTVMEHAITALNAVGIDEFQTLSADAAVPANFVPNLAWNESAPKTAGEASELELTVDEDGILDEVAFDETPLTGSAFISIVPSGGNGGCTADGITISNDMAGNTESDSSVLNLINDVMGDGDCHLVAAVGFGKDVPGTTFDSRVAIGIAPTAGSENVNPSENYARYIALFQLATTEGPATTAVTAISADDVLPRARLVAIVDAEGRTLDQAIANANEN